MRNELAIFDIETDGLEATKIHCLVYYSQGEYVSVTSYDRMRDFFTSEAVLIGHNIIRYDIPTVERILGIDLKDAQLIDTLPLSWYLEPDRMVHGLESWGVTFGVPKPLIDDWENLPVEEYIHRCTEDVKINVRLWSKFKKDLLNLYGSKDKVDHFLNYIQRKFECAREQERSGWKLDVERTRSSLKSLEDAKANKLIDLTRAMPRVGIYVQRSRPTRPYKKDGTLSVAGARWASVLKKAGLGDDYEGDFNELINEIEGNPSSHQQVKDWLYSLGWKPITFKYKRDKKTGETKSIPQVNLEHGAGICPSIVKLYPREPSLELLDGLSVLSHRISILKGFLENVSNDGYVKAEVQGLTNTLRFKHAVVVNLPKVNKAYGEIMRGVLIAPDGYELCGSDQMSLEDRLKQHYIYDYDPAYVEEMNVPDYDPHLSLALSASVITLLQVEKYKSEEDKSIKPIRDIFKNGNYACQYGAGPARLALTADISLKEAKKVWKAYWSKNWAIKEVAKHQRVKKVDGQLWLFNPISEFWYSLRYEKDIFSTLVQGSAAYVFDLWVDKVREKRSQLTAQFHDELVACLRLGHRFDYACILISAINETNQQLKLNRKLDVSIQFGENYASIH